MTISGRGIGGGGNRSLRPDQRFVLYFNDGGTGGKNYKVATC